ncbi:MAG: protein phosphatase 2C domain-containing protein [Desulfobacterales bacterium]|nr:protein phosphatase 2C domain-containing protein [Desulfobacterales bacterium]
MTDVGRRRKGNEDALYLDDQQGLYVVSDGMGGHRAGEVASELVVKTIRDVMAGFETPAAVDGSLSPVADRLVGAIYEGNRKVFEAGRGKDAYRGMGATVSAAVLTDKTLITANVGDSPIYLIHDGHIDQLSVTHNVVSEQAAFDPEAASSLGEDVKYLLTRAMGIEESVSPDVFELPFFRGDAVVISSDGLSDLVSPEEIQAVVGEQTADRACRTLVDMANQRGGHDNITVIVVKIKEIKQRGLIGKLRSGLARKAIGFLQRYL